jgi:methionyl-tRNA synthetase
MNKEKIPYKEFAKLDIKVGKILDINDHPNADKLYILKVDLAEDTTRQIIAGLKPYYKKEQLLNKKAIFITNLEPATIRGEVSNGMILAADNNKGKVIFLTSESEIETGSKIR